MRVSADEIDDDDVYPPRPDCNSTVAYFTDLDGEPSIVEVTHDGTCPALL
ncbi:MAG: hypothetical protein ACSLE6_05620 [Mycobacterium sp.]